jgi:hypothetical protein
MATRIPARVIVHLVEIGEQLALAKQCLVYAASAEETQVVGMHVYNARRALNKAAKECDFVGWVCEGDNKSNRAAEAETGDRSEPIQLSAKR